MAKKATTSKKTTNKAPATGAAPAPESGGPGILTANGMVPPAETPAPEPVIEKPEAPPISDLVEEVLEKVSAAFEANSLFTTEDFAKNLDTKEGRTAALVRASRLQVTVSAALPAVEFLHSMIQELSQSMKWQMDRVSKEVAKAERTAWKQARKDHANAFPRPLSQYERRKIRLAKKAEEEAKSKAAGGDTAPSSDEENTSSGNGDAPQTESF